MEEEKKKTSIKIKVIRIVLTIFALALMIGIMVYLFPVMKNLSTTEGQIAFKNKVDETGILGLLSLFGLQVAQIFLFIIPGEPLEILAGMCYGWFLGTVFIIVSNLVTSIIIFLAVRKLGKEFIYNFNDEEKINKLTNSRLFKNKKKIEYILFILFLVPGTPKDLIVYISGLLPISFKRFIIISTLARIPSIISSTLAGANIAVGDLKTSIILYLSIFVIVLAIIFIMNKFDKDKTTEDIIKTLVENKK